VSVASGLALVAAGSVVAGIPLALAALVAGLAITESADSAEARGRLPFRDLFAVLFFVAIGTLIDHDAFVRGCPGLGSSSGSSSWRRSGSRSSSLGRPGCAAHRSRSASGWARSASSASSESSVLARPGRRSEADRARAAAAGRDRQ
jgi:hypothetical protein